ncbi:PDZ domain-containing protein [Actinomadura soli]|uniref:PDZ domain-containing protein n=1 Tax=Actinomadura soli TaxID=2508997 RepID=A0A5C4J7U3_9ACTN|nr:PDZ domain-containing protein [Actinomadura soli]TMQ94748.1 PDZ domain-containing protein [Actinomadura soli]
MKSGSVTVLAAATIGVAALACTGTAAVAATQAPVVAPRSLQPQSNVPNLSAPGGAQTVSYPPDHQVRHHPTRVTFVAPNYTRIVEVPTNCNVGCTARIGSGGRTATLDVTASGYTWSAPLQVRVAANADAPLEGGRFSGTTSTEGVTQPLTVNILPGTQGSVSMFPTDEPGRGGVRVRFVMEDSNAERSGLKTDDRITAVDGKPIANGKELNAALEGRRAGSIVPITITRAGEERTLNLRLD